MTELGFRLILLGGYVLGVCSASFDVNCCSLRSRKSEGLLTPEKKLVSWPQCHALCRGGGGGMSVGVDFGPYLVDGW